jgi:uncharacterized protein
LVVLINQLGLQLMIREAVICTLATDGQAHITPLGYRMRGTQVLLAPFVPSNTLDNLQRQPQAVLNFTDDVRIIAGALTGRRDWPTVPVHHVPVPRLANSLAHWELEVTQYHPDATRPEFECRILKAENHAPFLGFNRAQAAVLELAILVSRLDWLAPEAVLLEMNYLRRAVVKTAGSQEHEAWTWLESAVAVHPLHQAAWAVALAAGQA